MNNNKNDSGDSLHPDYLQAFFVPATYHHPTDKISMLQTHASWVFLTGDFVYKLKKPVDFGFMDFSTLAKRKFYCEQELLLNRRLLADIYLEVLPVCLTTEGCNLSGDGEIVDYCLKMVQFEQSGLFDKQLQAGTLNPLWMDSLAMEVASFHGKAEINHDVNFYHGRFLADHIEENLKTAAAYVGQALSQQLLDSLSAFAAAEMAKRQQLLRQRQQSLHIRHCHGDLHLRNIALINGRPGLFDCIEFNDAFRIIDTMNDVAFLVMDCDAHSRPDLGFRFLSRYLEYSGDYEGLTLLPLYLFYRATVRGKVASILANSLPLAQQQPHWSEARKYFELALSYSKKKEAELFAIGGLSGSGKSHLALLGCGREQAIIIRSDAIRKRVHQKYPELDLYRSKMNRKAYQAMFDAAETVLNAGYSVILDATFLHADSRKQVKEIATRHHSPLFFYWLSLDKEILIDRVKKRMQENRDISDADLEVLHRQWAEYQPPQEQWLERLSSNHVWPCRVPVQ